MKNEVVRAVACTWSGVVAADDSAVGCSLTSEMYVRTTSLDNTSLSPAMTTRSRARVSGVHRQCHCYQFLCHFPQRRSSGVEMTTAYSRC